MKLDRLDILGFKSFAEPTTLRFNPGITAIVGPNGCGKSNVIDAVRWVLGEQRPTALRGSSLQEVVFNGTRTRGPLGMAEVTLTFSNALGLLPVELPEVSITRRVFRDGETQYLLNRTPCQLREMRDIFLGTGVGSSAYAVIEQKMVDAILSDRAEERRFLFEEAAGVTRYKARRRESLRKLEAVETDLRRLEDVLGEARRTTNSLRRQVGRAQRWEQLGREELRLAVALAEAELEELGVRERPLRETIARLEDSRARGTGDLGRREAALEAIDVELASVRAAEREARGGLDRESQAIAELERDRVRAEEGGRRAAADAERLEVESRRHAEEAERLLGRRAEAEDRLLAAVRETDEARVDAAGRARAAEELAARLETARAHTAAAREAHGVLGEERLVVRAEMARATASREAGTVRRAELAAALAALRERGGDGSPADDDPGLFPSDAGLAGEAASAPAPGRSLATLEQELAAAREERRRREAEHAEADARLAETDSAVAELETRRREIAARLDTLEGVRGRAGGGFGESARNALEARAAVAPGLRGPLGSEVEVLDPRHARAVEAFLDVYLEALVTHQGAEVEAVLDFWRERNQGGAVWPLGDSVAPPAPPLDDAAREHLLCRGTHAAALRGDLDRHREALFGRLLLAEDFDRAVRLRRALNGNGGAGWYVVAALSGEILEPTGIVRLPHPPGDAGVAVYRQEEELRLVLDELARELAAETSRAAGLRALAGAAAAAETAARERESEVRGRLEGAERELQREHGVREAARRRLEALERDLRVLDARLLEEGRTARDAEEREAAMRDELEQAGAALARREGELEAVRAEREAALREAAAAELAAEQRASAQAALERESRWLSEAAEEQRRLSAARAAELEERRAAFASLEVQAAALAADAASRHRILAARRLEHAGVDERVRALEEDRAAREAEARAARRAHEEHARELHAEELRLADLLHRRDSIRTVIETEFGRPLAALVADVRAMAEAASATAAAASAMTEAASAAAPGLDVLRERLREVRERKSALGPVNLLALEEFGAEKERLDFLDTQVADLVRARDDLREAIRRINATARDLFLDTFARARENFHTTFGTLFEGGSAEISLEEGVDPLEAAIEISASPRGKRVQAVSVLSGGERALTALSLLFAMYLVKPSPFCILDEVDAPLDDANIGRFLRMLQRFSDRTQFVVVTHNKRTMEAADWLYGVTMEEPGVSTIVSVDFAGRRTAREPDVRPAGVPNGSRPRPVDRLPRQPLLDLGDPSDDPVDSEPVSHEPALASD